MIKKFVFALAASAVVLGVTACNTVKGMGEDIESVGQAGDEAIH
ncbi:MAG TPA: entericidin A/B family lipoprotein [Novosphingobium sp.]|nr:entericidin A/B family lipoprotein [Novosphingobium sp.]